MEIDLENIARKLFPTPEEDREREVASLVAASLAIRTSQIGMSPEQRGELRLARLRIRTVQDI